MAEITWKFITNNRWKCNW